MPGNDRAESEDTSQDEKTRQLGLRGSNNYFARLVSVGYLRLLMG